MIEFARAELPAKYRGEMLQWLDERSIAPYIRVKENPNRPTDLYGIDQFTYVPEKNCYICPEGKPLKYVGINPLNRTRDSASASNNKGE